MEQCVALDEQRICGIVFLPTNRTLAYKQTVGKFQIFVEWKYSNQFPREPHGAALGEEIHPGQCPHRAIECQGQDHIGRSVEIGHFEAIMHILQVGGDSGDPALVALQIV